MPVIVYSFFFGLKIDNFQMKKFDIFLIFDQNIVCGYTLEPPRRGGSNEYPQSMFGVFPCIPKLCYIKVGFEGAYVVQTCFPDGLSFLLPRL